MAQTSEAEKVVAVVTALRIKPGLQWTGPKKLPFPNWSIGFYYDREYKTFAAKVYVGERTSTMGLGKEDVETRGKSQWMTDNVWRLSEKGIIKVAESIIKLSNDPRAKV